MAHDRSEPVRVERRNTTWILCVDRPETRNAIDPAVHAALSAALDRVEAAFPDEARAIVLTGAGGTFVSGGDLKLIRERPFDETLALSQAMTELLDRLERLPLPVLAALEGYAFGGGCEIMLACDYRIASPALKVSFRQAAMGLTTGWGATTRLRQLVPRSVAARLLMAAEVVPAQGAHRLGLVDELSDDPLARALSLAEQIAQQSARAIAGFKDLLRTAYAQPAPRARAREWEVFADLWGGPDHRAALDAYFAKR